MVVVSAEIEIEIEIEVEVEVDKRGKKERETMVHVLVSVEIEDEAMIKLMLNVDPFPSHEKGDEHERFQGEEVEDGRMCLFSDRESKVEKRLLVRSGFDRERQLGMDRDVEIGAKG